MSELLTINDGEISVDENSTTQSFNTSELIGDGTGDLLSTARTQSGSPASELTDDTLIRHGNTEITLGVAQKLGIVRKINEGHYIDLTQEDIYSQSVINNDNDNEYSQVDDDSNTPVAELLSTREESKLSHASDQIPQSVHDSIVDRYINMGYDSIDWVQVSHAVGESYDNIKQSTDFILNTLSKQASVLLEKEGVDPEDFYEWANNTTERKYDLRKAMYAHYYQRNLGGYRELADNYLRSVPPTPEAAADHYKVTTHNGVTLIEIDGQEYDIRVAAKLGLI